MSGMPQQLRHWLRAMLCCALLVLGATGAQAQTDAATAEQLMRRSGLWNQLEGVAPQIRAGIVAQAAEATQDVDPAELERLGLAADAAFAAERLRDAVRVVMAARIDPAQLPALRAWYDSDTGRRFSALEDAASQRKGGDGEVVLREAIALVRAMPAERRATLARMVVALQAVESFANMTVNTTIAVELGARRASAAEVIARRQEIQSQILRERPQWLERLASLAMLSLAHVYAAASDDELARYVAFLETPAGRHYNDLSMAALDMALIEAGRAFGRAIAAPAERAARV